MPRPPTCLLSSHSSLQADVWPCRHHLKALSRIIQQKFIADFIEIDKITKDDEVCNLFNLDIKFQRNYYY